MEILNRRSSFVSRTAFVAALVLTLCFTAAGLAQATHTPSKADAEAIDATLTTFGGSLTAMDFATFETLFTDDADFVNVVGMHWSGKAQIVKAHKIVFTTRYHGNPQHFTEKTESVLAPGVVLVVGTIRMDDYTDHDGKRMTDNISRMTLVLVKRENRWLIRSVENTSVDANAAHQDPGK